MPTASLFGSSLAGPTDSCWTLAQDLSRGLVERGFTIKNGGYGGVMAASSQAAREAGGSVVGVTVEHLSGSRRANPYLSREISAPDLLERVRFLIRDTDVFYALEQGGPGTLNEVFLVWAMTILGETAGQPLVLVGSGWPDLVELLQREFRVSDDLLKILVLAPDLKAALDVADRVRERRSP